MTGKIASARRADGYGGATLQKHERHGLADDIAAADHDGLLTLDCHADVVEHRHASGRRAGCECRFANHQTPDVLHMKTIDVFFHRNGLEYFGLCYLRGQRKLDEDAVDGWVSVERLDTRQHV